MAETSNGTKPETMETSSEATSTKPEMEKPKTAEEAIERADALMIRAETEFEMNVHQYDNMPEKNVQTYRDVSDEAIKNDYKTECNCKSLVVHPIRATTMTPNVMLILSQKCQEFTIKYKDLTNKGDASGYLVMRLQNYEDVEFFTKNKIKLWTHDDVQVHALKHTEKVADVLKKNLKNDNKGTEFSQYEYIRQSLIVDNLPDNITEQELGSLFPDATRVVIARDNQYHNKGYAYALYGSVADSVTAEKKYEEGVKYADVTMTCVRVGNYRKKWEEWKDRLAKEHRQPRGNELKPVAGEKPVFALKFMREMMWCVGHLKKLIVEAPGKNDPKTVKLLTDALDKMKKTLNADRDIREENNNMRRKAAGFKVDDKKRKSQNPRNDAPPYKKPIMSNRGRGGYAVGQGQGRGMQGQGRGMQGQGWGMQGQGRGMQGQGRGGFSSAAHSGFQLTPTTPAGFGNRGSGNIPSLLGNISGRSGFAERGSSSMVSNQGGFAERGSSSMTSSQGGAQFDEQNVTTKQSATRQLISGLSQLLKTVDEQELAQQSRAHTQPGSWGTSGSFGQGRGGFNY